MTARDYCKADKALPVEQFNTGRKKGCIVRFDFVPVVNRVPVEGSRRGRRGQPQEEEGQYREVETDLVTFSILVYPEVPTPEKVEEDIRADLAVRYAGQDAPEIDFEQYRTAIANL